VAFAEGLSRVSFGRVAKRLGISDRTVVYYFPTKDALVGAVLLAVGLRLQQSLAPVFAELAADHRALARATWPVLSRPDVDDVFAVFFEANGLAAAGHEPYATVVPQLVEAWLAWAAEHLQGDPGERRAAAAATIALIDGLLLLRQLAGPEIAQSAAARLGIIPG
jgi:AcrR family transcriptional regulator